MREHLEEIQKVAAKAVMDMVNCHPFNNDDFVEGILKGHRTLQQCFGGIIARLLWNWAKAYERGNYDLRCEDLCKFAHEAMKPYDEVPKFRFV